MLNARDEASSRSRKPSAEPVRRAVEGAATRVLLVDDHDLFRAGMKLLLESMGSFEVETAASASEALETLAAGDINVVVLDIVMPEKDGIWALGRISRSHPDVPVIVLSATEDDGYITEALDTGARGFLTKSATAQQLSDAIGTVLAERGVYLHPSIAERLVARQRSGPRGADALTDREVEVLTLLVDGAKNLDIAARLGLSQKRVKAILTLIFRKLDVANRTQAAARALQDGIVQSRSSGGGHD